MSSAANLMQLLEEMRDLPEFVELGPISVNQVGNFGNTPLHVASSWDDPSAVEILIKGGADVNASGEEGYTPLHRAAGQGSAKAARILLANGANRQARNDDGMTPMELARVLDHKEIVALLEAN